MYRSLQDAMWTRNGICVQGRRGTQCGSPASKQLCLIKMAL